MIELLRGFIQALPSELLVIGVAALPISELRGAIPMAVALGMSMEKAYALSCIGNLLPVIPLLLFLDPVATWLRRFPLWKGFFVWLFDRTAKRAKIVRRFEAIGLTLFVMIPLPITGAWTGCAAALLFRLPFRVSFLAITLGVMLSGIIVSFAVKAGLHLFYKTL